MDIYSRNQAFIELIKFTDIGYHDPHQIIDLAAHAIELHNLWELNDGLRKLFKPGGVVLSGANGNKCRFRG